MAVGGSEHLPSAATFCTLTSWRRGLELKFYWQKIASNGMNFFRFSFERRNHASIYIIILRVRGPFINYFVPFLYNLTWYFTVIFAALQCMPSWVGSI
jgi:hypothetical protein